VSGIRECWPRVSARLKLTMAPGNATPSEAFTTRKKASAAGVEPSAAARGLDEAGSSSGGAGRAAEVAVRTAVEEGGATTTLLSGQEYATPRTTKTPNPSKVTPRRLVIGPDWSTQAAAAPS
jgi:hypothetical protein